MPDETVVTTDGRLEVIGGDEKTLVGPGEWVSFTSLIVVHQFSGTIIEAPDGGQSARAVCGHWLPDWGWGLSTNRDRCFYCEAHIPHPHGNGQVYPVPTE